MCAVGTEAHVQQHFAFAPCPPIVSDQNSLFPCIWTSPLPKKWLSNPESVQAVGVRCTPWREGVYESQAARALLLQFESNQS